MEGDPGGEGESGFPLARGFRGGLNLKNQGGAGLAGDAGIDRLMHAMALKKAGAAGRDGTARSPARALGPGRSPPRRPVGQAEGIPNSESQKPLEGPRIGRARGDRRSNHGFPATKRTSPILGVKSRWRLDSFSAPWSPAIWRTAPCGRRRIFRPRRSLPAIFQRQHERLGNPTSIAGRRSLVLRVGAARRCFLVRRHPGPADPPTARLGGPA